MPLNFVPARRRIVVVEEDLAVREMIRTTLERAGYEVTLFGDGREALRDTRHHPPPDLIVLDVSLPDMNGREFRAHQKRHPTLSETPVLVTSADSWAGAVGIDAARVVARPFSAESLVTSIEEIFATGVAEPTAREAADAARLTLLGTLVTGIAHEINNPLASLVVNLEMLRAALPPSGGRQLEQMLGDCAEAASRIRGIVRDVAAVVRREAPETGVLRVESVLDSSLRLVSHRIRHRAQVVKRYGNTPAVRAPDGRLGQLFINLLVNAAHAIPEGSSETNSVRVTTRANATGACVIEITDTGVGIAPDLIARVFEPFFTTKPFGEGTGLGLSISRAIVASLGGEIEVESELGIGSTFRVVLPAASCAAATGADPIRRAESAPKRRLLIVDDDDMLARALARTLLPHEVLLAASGTQALEMLLADQRFDLILCDLLLPGMTGMELHTELSARAPGMQARLVFMTGGAVTGRQHEFIRGIPNRVLEKPFDVAELRVLLEG